jgi:hypothetical protein
MCIGLGLTMISGRNNFIGLDHKKYKKKKCSRATVKGGRTMTHTVNRRFRGQYINYSEFKYLFVTN